MIDLLQTLEPVRYKNKTILFKELDEINEINFIQHGTIGVGFEINRNVKFGVRFDNGCVVGAFGLTFRQRSRYIYQCFSVAHGYFIRKEYWLEILENHPNIQRVMK